MVVLVDIKLVVLVVRAAVLFSISRLAYRCRNLLSWVRLASVALAWINFCVDANELTASLLPLIAQFVIRAEYFVDHGAVAAELSQRLVDVPRLDALSILVAHHHFAKAVIRSLGSGCLFFAGPSCSRFGFCGGFTHVKDHYVSKSLLSRRRLSLLGLIHALRHSNEFKLNATLGLCHGRSVPYCLLLAFVLDVGEEFALLSLFFLALLFENLLSLLISLLLFLLDFPFSVEQTLLVLLLLFNILSHDLLAFILQFLDLLPSYVLVLHLLHFLFFLDALNT